MSGLGLFLYIKGAHSPSYAPYGSPGQAYVNTPRRAHLNLHVAHKVKYVQYFRRPTCSFDATLFRQGVERDVGLHTLLDAPSQFLELWTCPPCGERN